MHERLVVNRHRVDIKLNDIRVMAVRLRVRVLQLRAGSGSVELIGGLLASLVRFLGTSSSPRRREVRLLLIMSLESSVEILLLVTLDEDRLPQVRWLELNLVEVSLCLNSWFGLA